MSLKAGGRNGARMIVLPLAAVGSLGVVVGTLWELLLACLASITCKASCRELSSSDNGGIWWAPIADKVWSLFEF